VKIFLISLMQLVSAVTFSQSFRQFTTDDGLPDESVFEVFQDSQGFIWFATRSGVSRFDGYKFTNYSADDGLADNITLGFYEDISGRIWFRSGNGKVSYYQYGKIWNSKNATVLKDLDQESDITMICEAQDSSILISYINYGFIKLTPENKIVKFDLKNDTTGYVRGVFENHDKTYTLFGEKVYSC
jgi:ligand-binding sensor domain-containing protein